MFFFRVLLSLQNSQVNSLSEVVKYTVVGKIAIFDEITIYLGNGYYGTLTISRRQLNDE